MAVNYDVICPFEGKVVHIYRQIGDWVEEGEAVFAVQVHSVPLDISSPVSGQLDKIEVILGEECMAGMILGSIYCNPF